MSRSLWSELTGAIRTRATLGRRLMSLLGLAVTLLLVWLVWRSVDPSRLADAFAGLSPGLIGLALLSLALAYTVKVLRWRLMLSSLGAHAGLSLAASTFLGSIALNNVLPLRAGDVARAVAFAHPLGLSPVDLVGALVLERVLDLAMLLAMLAIVLLVLPPGLVPVALSGSAAALIAVGAIIGLVVLAMARPLEAWLRELAGRIGAAPLSAALRFIADMLAAVAGLTRAPLLARLVALTACAWAFESGLYLATAHAFGLATPWASGALGFALGTLSTLVPSSPGYVGTFHFFVMQAVAALGAATDQAAAYAIATHGLLWLPATLAGAIGLLALSLRPSARPVADPA